MGWLWNKTSPTTSSTDPLRDLDPSLRDFLSKESPIKYEPSAAPPPPPPCSAPTQHPPTPPPEATTPSVPSESLYPDGRYADLWSSYRPLSAIENETKSDQEKLTDVYDAYKARKAQIGRAAVENCAFEQMAVDECLTKGAWKDKVMMCRAENREFERCYAMQSRFLKALGYLSTYERPPEIDEQIQMHADTLYHRMLAQEKAIADAKAAGQPAPQFAAILSPDAPAGQRTTSTETFPATASSSASGRNAEDLPALSATTQNLLNAEAQQRLRERLLKMPPAERELEERSVQMEARTAEDIAVRIKEVEEGRKRRREEGKETAADTVSGWFGW